MSRLHIENLTVAYAARPVIDDICLRPCDGGELIALLGPNAAGKSSLQRAIAGLVPSRGKLLLDGTPLAALPRQARLQRIGYLPQSLPQTSALLVFEVLYSGLRAGCPMLTHGAAEAAVETALAQFDLEGIALRRLDQLSGGQRQMVGLAQVVARQPQVLLLDEPTSALDLRWQLTVIERVRAFVRASGAVCMIAVHDLNLALRFCDRCVVLAEGRLAFDAAPADFDAALLEKVWGVSGRIEPCSLGYRTVMVDAALATPLQHQGTCS